MEWSIYFVQGLEFLFLGIGTYFDVKEKEIPISFFVMFGSLGIILNILWKYQSIQNVIIGAGIGMLFIVAGWVTKESIGYGDGLGLAVIGVLEGWQGLILISFFSFLLSGVYGLWRMVGWNDSKDDRIVFYPFLLLSFLGVACI